MFTDGHLEVFFDKSGIWLLSQAVSVVCFFSGYGSTSQFLCMPFHLLLETGCFELFNDWLDYFSSPTALNLWCCILRCAVWDMLTVTWDDSINRALSSLFLWPSSAVKNSSNGSVFFSIALWHKLLNKLVWLLPAILLSPYLLQTSWPAVYILNLLLSAFHHNFQWKCFSLNFPKLGYRCSWFLWGKIRSYLVYCLLFIIYVFIWLCWVFVSACRLSLVGASGGYSLVEMHGLLIVVACISLQSMGSRHTGSVVVSGLSCPTACGIFPDQESNLCPQHWCANS